MHTIFEHYLNSLSEKYAHHLRHYQACHSLKFRLFECNERPVVMASVKSFCGKQTQHRFLFDAVSQIEDDDPESTDVVLTQIIPLSTKDDLS